MHSDRYTDAFLQGIALRGNISARKTVTDQSHRSCTQSILLEQRNYSMQHPVQRINRETSRKKRCVTQGREDASLGEANPYGRLRGEALQSRQNQNCGKHASQRQAGLSGADTGQRDTT